MYYSAAAFSALAPVSSGVLTAAEYAGIVFTSALVFLQVTLVLLCTFSVMHVVVSVLFCNQFMRKLLKKMMRKHKRLEQMFWYLRAHKRNRLQSEHKKNGFDVKYKEEFLEILSDLTRITEAHSLKGLHRDLGTMDRAIYMFTQAQCSLSDKFTQEELIGIEHRLSICLAYLLSLSTNRPEIARHRINRSKAPAVKAIVPLILMVKSQLQIDQRLFTVIDGSDGCIKLVHLDEFLASERMRLYVEDVIDKFEVNALRPLDLSALRIIAAILKFYKLSWKSSSTPREIMEEEYDKLMAYVQRSVPGLKRVITADEMAEYQCVVREINKTLTDIKPEYVERMSREITYQDGLLDVEVYNPNIEDSTSEVGRTELDDQVKFEDSEDSL